MSWFGGRYRDDRIPFAQFATDPNTVLDVFVELSLPIDQHDAWRRDRTGCVVGRRIATDRSWQIGDKIPLQGDVYGCNLELTIVGIVDGPNTSELEFLWFHASYMEDSLRASRIPVAGKVGTIRIRTASQHAADTLPSRIESTFANSPAPVRVTTEEAFQQSFVEMVGDVHAFIRNTALAVVFSLVCVLANALSMSLRERTRELAVLKAIGFSRRGIFGLVLAESLVLTLAGGLSGAIGAKLFVHLIDLDILVLVGLSLFYVPWSSVLFGVAVSVLVGIVSAVVPASRAAQLRVVDGLRKVI